MFYLLSIICVCWKNNLFFYYMLTRLLFYIHLAFLMSMKFTVDVYFNQPQLASWKLVTGTVCLKIGFSICMIYIFSWGVSHNVCISFNNYCLFFFSKIFIFLSAKILWDGMWISLHTALLTPPSLHILLSKIFNRNVCQ